MWDLTESRFVSLYGVWVSSGISCWTSYIREWLTGTADHGTVCKEGWRTECTNENMSRPNWAQVEILHGFKPRNITNMMIRWCKAKKNSIVTPQFFCESIPGIVLATVWGMENWRKLFNRRRSRFRTVHSATLVRHWPQLGGTRDLFSPVHNRNVICFLNLASKLPKQQQSKKKGT
jgi:hypothetical protein